MATKLPPPQTQLQEVLYYLIQRLSIDRRTMMYAANVWNLTANISRLRRKGLAIKADNQKSINKFGREVNFVHYICVDKKHATELYKAMQLEHTANNAQK